MMNVSKKYGKGILAVNNLSVRIQDGEFVYVVGPSGAGKSTFIKMMYRQEKATKGRITVGKYDLTKMREREIPYLRRYVGVVFQDFKLLPRLTVYENVAYAMEVIEKAPKEIQRKVEEVIMDILERINQQGTTIVMATHNSQIVNEKKHRVLAIEMGRIVRDQEEGEYGYED